MGKPTGFMEKGRQPPERIPVIERIDNSREFYKGWTEQQARDQGARCMNCAVPFCHMGCPLGNLIPQWNDLVYRGQWESALKALHSTNNFPEFTGRICPAPCEASCVLAINQDPVTIEYIEKAISDRGWKEGWIIPKPPTIRTGKKVAVVGSGPAGLAAAQQLNRAGHTVIVFERDERIGGILRFGIPDFKLEKHVVERRVDQMVQEGVEFVTRVHIGKSLPVQELIANFDAICVTGGSTVPRDLDVPGRDLDGIHFAMDYLTQQNRLLAGERVPIEERITAEGKRVVILGGGDTGADCLGTAHRQGAEVVHQFEIMPEPPSERPSDNPWPEWPKILMTSAAHEEGGIRDYNILTKHFSGNNDVVQKLHGVRLEWGPPDDSGRPSMAEVPGSEFEIEADLVLLAMGFLHPERTGMLADLKVELDPRGNVATDENKMTSVPGVFAAGDMARGQSLVVWALAEGREAARGIDQYLMGKTSLPRVLSSA
ncbi:MAG: glutamate synthase subunit beta [Chloroflexi bacterium]|nr:glutamate synthase subunit beta [Chloroflexota bacterium]